jgi:hypothetical protein
VSAHLGLDQLADLGAGALDEATALRARTHLAGCERCQAEAAALDEVSAVLGGAADTGPMPAPVAARLDAALAAAGAAGDVAAGDAGVPPAGARAVDVRPAGRAGGDVVPLARGERRGDRLRGRVLQAAAAAVVLLAGIGLLVPLLQGRDGSGGAADSASTAGGADSGGAESAPVVQASGTDYTPRSVAAAVPRLLTGTVAPRAAKTGPAPGTPQPGGSAPAPSAAASDAPERLRGGPGLAECVTELAGEPTTPLAVDLARYQGRPAAVIVLPTPGDPATVDVNVVEPSCARADARLLYFARVPRS